PPPRRRPPLLLARGQPPRHSSGAPTLTPFLAGWSGERVLPRIGVSGSVAPHRIGTRRTFVNEPYLLGVGEAGGLPLVVAPSHQGDGLRELYELLDRLLLTGGEDVAAARYAAAVGHPQFAS